MSIKVNHWIQNNTSLLWDMNNCDYVWWWYYLILPSHTDWHTLLSMISYTQHILTISPCYPPPSPFIPTTDLYWFLEDTGELLLLDDKCAVQPHTANIIMLSWESGLTYHRPLVQNYCKINWGSVWKRMNEDEGGGRRNMNEEDEGGKW